MVCCSDESGPYGIHVRHHPGPGEKWQVSSVGGNKMMVVPVETVPTFSPGQPRVSFEVRFQRHVGPWPDFDVTMDSRRCFVVRGKRGDLDGKQIRRITHFAEGLKP
jgi:hypothetical protein